MYLLITIISFYFISTFVVKTEIKINYELFYSLHKKEVERIIKKHEKENNKTKSK